MTQDLFKWVRWAAVAGVVIMALDAAALQGDLALGLFYLVMALVVKP